MYLMPLVDGVYPRGGDTGSEEANWARIVGLYAKGITIS
jgi:hypothetical protein